mgnify:CR=1 FL=1|tara:strand:- start:203 stop:478 length:276 start_codon:yes stop_codon:yes gene_type:complete
MDLDIYYPYGLPFYTDQKLINIKFINNEDHLINIYFVKGDKLGNLAAIIFSHQERKYQFPDKSIVAIVSDKNPNKYYCFIKLKDGMTYIYP